MSDRTVVYVCDHGLVKVRDGINIWQQGVVRASHPAVAKYPEAFRPVEMGADGLARMDVLGPAATLPRLIDFITPVGVEPAGAEPSEPADPPGSQLPGDLPGGLTWPRIEASYRRLAGADIGWRSRRREPGEPSRPELAKDLDVSPATLKRACDKAGKGTRWPPAGL